MSYRIALVDDKPQVLNNLSQEINYSGEVEIVLTARNGEDYLQQMKQLPLEKQPQIVLMDIDMPVMNGIDAVRSSSSLYQHIQYIMLTVIDDDDKLFEALKAGADGYLLKEERADAILAAIKEVIEKEGAPMSPRIARKTLNMLIREQPQKSLSNDEAVTNLSDRETEILKNMVNGLDYRQIGEKLFISPNTVRNHISRIYDKLHISCKAQAVQLAIRNKWV